jgi:hypothetical protein
VNDDRNRLRLAAVLVGCSAVIHVAAALEHLSEWWAFSAIFAITSLLQGGWGVAVWRRGPSASRRFLWAGTLLGLGIVAVWIASRTTGLPVGPERFEAEKVGLLDGQATANELLACLLVLPALIGPRRVRRPVVYWSEALGLLAVCASFFMLAAGVGHEH